MSRLDDDLIKRIMDFPEDVTHTDVSKELGVNRMTVSKYRSMKDFQKEAADVLDGKERLSKEEQEKQEIVRSYSPQELKEILTHLQTNTNKSINKIIGDKGHLKFALLADTHLGNKMAAKKELADFYKRAGDE